MLAREGEGMVAARAIKISLGPDGNAVGALGRCLGPCEHKGTVMDQHVLNEQGNVLPYQKFCRLAKENIKVLLNH